MTRLRGLYALTDESRGELLVRRVAAVLRGGAVMVQYRNKTAAPDGRREDAARLLELCRARGAPLIVNDDVALAVAIGADGVHLGRDDASLADARSALGPRAVVGVSCYADFARARQATEAGASYVAFGSFFASPTKPAAVRAPLALLTRARAELPVPVCAIGGITAENGSRLVEAGADLLAVISALYGEDPDDSRPAEAFAGLWEEARGG